MCSCTSTTTFESVLELVKQLQGGDMAGTVSFVMVPDRLGADRAKAPTAEAVSSSSFTFLGECLTETRNPAQKPRVVGNVFACLAPSEGDVKEVMKQSVYHKHNIWDTSSAKIIPLLTVHSSLLDSVATDKVHHEDEPNKVVPGTRERLVVLPDMPNVQGNQLAVKWLYPSTPMAFHAFDVVNVSYLSYQVSPTMFTWCTFNGSSIDFKDAQPAQPGNGWVLVELKFEYLPGQSCWFNLQSGSEPDKSVNSEKFSIILQRRSSPTTLGLQEPSRTTTVTPAPTTTAPTTAGATPSDASEHRQLSAGAKAGIGVGVALGALLLFGLVFFLGFRFRGRRTDTSGQQQTVPELETTQADGASQPKAQSYMAPEETIPIREPAEVYGMGVGPDLYSYQQQWRGPGIPELQTEPNVETHKYRV
ncbi:hypothetical protein PspLS_11190 [Pyricularia sp. CBS 133598]|nr:hypothetical protein PspLS_11190 [Pyricularia sp. CBS 133598]